VTDSDGLSNMPLTLRSSPAKWWKITGGCAAFGVIGVLMIRDGDMRGWFVGGLFGIGTIGGVATLVWPARLRIDDRAMRLDQWWRHLTFDFDRCGEFRVWTNPVARRNSIVVFDYAGPVLHPRLVRMNRVLGAESTSLPDTFGMPASELAALLNARRRQLHD
jgi:hypothetical protein